MLGEAHTEAQMSQNDPLQVSALHLLHRAGQCAGDVFQAEMVAGDLTPRQFAVLVAVSQDEGLSQTSLVRKTGIDRSDQKATCGSFQSQTIRRTRLKTTI